MLGTVEECLPVDRFFVVVARNAWQVACATTADVFLVAAPNRSSMLAICTEQFCSHI